LIIFFHHLLSGLSVCRHHLVQMLCANPPFTAKDGSSSLNSVQLVDRIWKLMKLVHVDC